MTKKDIDKQIKELERQKYAKLYAEITATLELPPDKLVTLDADGNEVKVTQMFFNEDGINVLRDMWARLKRYKNESEQRKEQLTALTKTFSRQIKSNSSKH